MWKYNRLLLELENRAFCGMYRLDCAYYETWVWGGHERRLSCNAGEGLENEAVCHGKSRGIPKLYVIYADYAQKEEEE